MTLSVPRKEFRGVAMRVTLLAYSGFVCGRRYERI